MNNANNIEIRTETKRTMKIGVESKGTTKLLFRVN